MTTQRNPVGWFEIYVQDMDRAKAFYQNTFQVELERLEGPGLELWVFPPLGQPNNPGCNGALVKMVGKDSGTGGTIIYFSCADCAQEASRATQNGGKIHLPKESIGQYGFIALVYDTEGNMIGLHSME
jgi:predicted enzyme related to lactoylglutathione lyase